MIEQARFESVLFWLLAQNESVVKRKILAEITGDPKTTSKGDKKEQIFNDFTLQCKKAGYYLEEDMGHHYPLYRLKKNPAIGFDLPCGGKIEEIKKCNAICSASRDCEIHYVRVSNNDKFGWDYESCRLYN